MNEDEEKKRMNEDENAKRKREKQKEYRERMKKNKEERARQWSEYIRRNQEKERHPNTFFGGGSDKNEIKQEEKKHKDDLEKNKELIQGDRFRCVTPFKRLTATTKDRLVSCKQEGNFAKGFTKFFDNRQQCIEYCNTE